jgi:3-oxoacyl-[acyl-carrier protein] reductase
MDLGIKNKVALVLGGGSGLGQAMALSLASEGCKVVVAGRTEANLQKTVAQIQKARGQAHAIAWDLAQLDQIDSHFAKIESLWGSVDILVNNTGGPPPTPAAGQAPQVWLQKFQEMVLSVIAITDRALPAMKEKRWGRVITSTSSGAIAPIPNLAISNTLRSSLHAWSKTLAREVAPFGITANIIVPGRIATERIRFLDESKAQRENRSVEDVMNESLKTIPMGRTGDPAEYGATAAFLASQGASYITGSVIRVDGGLITSL